jgi:hypothetical protein
MRYPHPNFARHRNALEQTAPVVISQLSSQRVSSQNRVLVLQAARELFGSEPADPKLDRTLKARGVNYTAIIDRIGPILQRRIALNWRFMSFELEDFAEPGFILAVHDIDAKTVIDLVGWFVKRPGAFGAYFGYAGLLGGDAALTPTSFDEEPCPIWGTPWSWLLSGARGCVVLDPRLAASILSQAPGSFQCEDAHQARWLIDTGAVPTSKLLVPALRVVRLKALGYQGLVPAAEVLQ